MKNTEKFISALLESWKNESVSYPFMQARFHKFLKLSCRETLETLFFKVYLNHPLLPDINSLRSFLIPQCRHLYHGISSFLPMTWNFPTTADLKSVVSREVRFVGREILILAINDLQITQKERSHLFHSLQLISPRPEYYQFEKINIQEIIEQIPVLLRKGDLLAELSDFSGLYFTAHELEPLWGSLQRYKFLPEEEAKLENFFNLAIKHQILATLQNFINRNWYSPYAKIACAVYITLGEIIPWAKHPFIRRLLAASYQEAKTLINLQK